MSGLILSPAGRRYGYKADLPDIRDFSAARMTLVKKVIPARVNLVKLLGPVKDQGNLGACTAFAGTGMREFLYRAYPTSETTKVKAPVFSPLFLYYKERELDGDVSEDAGSYGRTSVRVMSKTGVCLEHTDPYHVSNFTRPPTPKQLTEALRFRAGTYHRLSSLDSMKVCLANKYVFVVGFTVYESFESTGWTVMPLPNPGEQVLGGHEVLFFGYDDAKAEFLVRNSWGPGWGDGGNFGFPYEAAARKDILQDAWTEQHR